MHWHKKHGEWEAHAYVDGASKYIGRYTTAMEAARARKDYMLKKTPESKKMINGVSSLSSVEHSEEDDECVKEKQQVLPVDSSISEIIKCGICLVPRQPTYYLYCISF